MRPEGYALLMGSGFRPGQVIAVLVIVGMALALRLYPIQFGLPLLLKPDENRMVEVAFVMGDARFCHWFLVYPHLWFILEWAVFMAVFVAGWTVGFFPSFKAFRVWRNGRPEVLHLVSRIPVALIGALSPALVQGLGTRFGGPAAGLVAALFLAVCPMHVKESMYFSVDVPMVFFALACVWVALEAVERDRPRWLWIAGALGGLSAGAKYPAAVLALPLTVAWGLGWQRARWSFGHLVACGALMIAAFLASTPMALVHPGALAEQMRILSGRLALPHGGVELGPGWLYHATVSMPEGFTLPILYGGVVGLVLYGFRGTGWILAAYLLAFFVTFARSHTVFQRYTLPLAPVLCLFAARAYLAGVDLLERRAGRAGRIVGWGIIALAVAVPLARSVAYVEFLAREDTRVAARRWFDAHVPAGARVALIGSPWVDIQIEKDYEAGEDPWRPERAGYLRMGREMKLTQWLPAKTYKAVYASDVAGAAGCEYAVLGDHPWHPAMRLDEPVMAAVAAAGELVWEIDPMRPGAERPRYDEQDAWLVPTSGFSALTAPGPRVRIYRLRR